MRRSRRAASPGFWAAVFSRGLALLALWWVLTEGGGGIGFAAIAVPLAVAATVALTPPHRQRLTVLGVLRFLPFFLWESLRGGVDVAWRALDPRMPLAPAIYEHPLRLADERERVLLASVLSLVPGTVSAELTADRIKLHVLDRRLPIKETTRRVETRIADLFGNTLKPAAARSKRSPAGGGNA